MSGYRDHEPMTLHGGGLRLDSDVQHMCPECGHPAKALCGTCKGTGLVTDLQLAAWQRMVLRERGGGLY